MCTAVLIGWDPATPPLPPHLGSYTRALLVSQDRRPLFVTPGLHSLHGRMCDRDTVGRSTDSHDQPKLFELPHSLPRSPVFQSSLRCHKRTSVTTSLQTMKETELEKVVNQNVRFGLMVAAFTKKLKLPTHIQCIFIFTCTVCTLNISLKNL